MKKNNTHQQISETAEMVSISKYQLRNGYKMYVLNSSGAASIRQKNVFDQKRRYAMHIYDSFF